MTWGDILDTSELPFLEMGKMVEINGVRMWEGVLCRDDGVGFFRGLWTQDATLAPGEIFVSYSREEESDSDPFPIMTVYRSFPFQPPDWKYLRDRAFVLQSGPTRSYELAKFPLSIEYFEDKADKIFSIIDTKPIKFARQISDLKSELDFITQYILDLEKFEDTFDMMVCDSYLDEVWFRQIEQIKMSVYSNISKESENDPNYG